MGKNIVVFSDGTGQEGGKSFNTNVYKVFNIIEDRTPSQIALLRTRCRNRLAKTLRKRRGKGLFTEDLQVLQVHF